MEDTDRCSDKFSWPGSECLNPPCLPPCCQNPGEVPQARPRQYWGAKSWGRSQPGPTSTQSSSAKNGKPAETPSARKMPEELPGTLGWALTAVPVRGVRAQADIAGYEQLWEGGADLLDCLDGRRVLRISSGASLIL